MSRDHPISIRAGKGLVWLIVIGMFVQLGVIVYVGVNARDGRTSLVESTRKGCERGKKSNGENAGGWRTAEQARLSSLAEDLHISYAAAEKLLLTPHSPDEPSDLTAARKYDALANKLEVRAKVNCKKAYP